MKNPPWPRARLHLKDAIPQNWDEAVAVQVAKEQHMWDRMVCEHLEELMQKSADFAAGKKTLKRTIQF